MISKKALEEFKAIYFKEYGVNLTDEEALPLAINLVELMKIILKPIKKPKSDDDK